MLLHLTLKISNRQIRKRRSIQQFLIHLRELASRKRLPDKAQCPTSPGLIGTSRQDARPAHVFSQAVNELHLAVAAMSLTRSQGLGLDFGTSSSVLFFRWLHHDLHPLSVLLGQQGFDALDEQMEGILLIVRLCLRQKQKLLRFERF